MWTSAWVRFFSPANLHMASSPKKNLHTVQSSHDTRWHTFAHITAHFVWMFFTFAFSRGVFRVIRNGTHSYLIYICMSKMMGHLELYVWKFGVHTFTIIQVPDKSLISRQCLNPHVRYPFLAHNQSADLPQSEFMNYNLTPHTVRC